MRPKHILLLLAVLLAGSSCSDFLDKAPISDNVDENFFTAENHLEPYCNYLYGLFPEHSGTGTFGYFRTDTNSDDMSGTGPNDNFLPQRVQVPSSGSYGNFAYIRNCNLFLTRVAENLENGSLKDNSTVQQYVGEMYFFRAYIYFNFLKSYGDFPIVTEVLTDGDYPTNVEANRRQPRNAVARFILSDLDKAISRLMPQNSAPAQRINRECALLFKSRVALYEGTWERYHAGTAFVPGGPGWPGDASLLTTSDIQTESDFFLQEAIDAAKQVGNAATLINEYANLYNQDNLSGADSEVLLWRMCSEDAKVQNQVVGCTHGYTAITGASGQKYIFVGGNSVGFTRSLVNSFLMKNGLPIYDRESGYAGDASLENVMTERDERLTSSVAKPGDKIMGEAFFQFPGLITAGGGQQVTSTGYIPRKGWQDNNITLNSSSSLALPIFRAAEAYLNYIEAYYVKNNALDETAKTYWKALRRRAKVDTDFQKTIDRTDLEQEIDLARYSGTDLIDPTLYNIRRERRSEFIADGMRLADLKRWRALDMMQGYWQEGINYWDEFHTEFEKALEDTQQSYEAPNQAATSKYLRPQGKNPIVLEAGGYCFEEANYLSPLSYDVFRLSTPEEGGDVATSIVYQNPGWPVQAGSYAIRK